MFESSDRFAADGAQLLEIRPPCPAIDQTELSCLWWSRWSTTHTPSLFLSTNAHRSLQLSSQTMRYAVIADICVKKQSQLFNFRQFLGYTCKGEKKKNLSKTRLMYIVKLYSSQIEEQEKQEQIVPERSAKLKLEP